MWRFADGTSTAKEAKFAMTESPIDGDAEGPLKAKGTLSMTSDGWTKGTFDEAAKTFTPASDATEPEAPENQG